MTPGAARLAGGSNIRPNGQKVSPDLRRALLCEVAISSLRADVLFVPVPAVSECRAMHQERDIVRIKRATVAAALHTLGPLSDFDPIVVDSGADRRVVDGLRDCGVPVEVAPI